MISEVENKYNGSLVPINDCVQTELLTIFNAYAEYTSKLLSDSYNYVWFEPSISAKYNSITFIRKYTNYHAEHEKAILEKQFEIERNKLILWLNRVVWRADTGRKAADSIEVRVFGNGVSFRAGVERALAKEESLDNLIKYLKENPNKMSFGHESKFQYVDQEENVQYVDASSLKEIMFRLMGIRETE